MRLKAESFSHKLSAFRLLLSAFRLLLSAFRFLPFNRYQPFWYNKSFPLVIGQFNYFLVSRTYLYSI